MPVTHVPTQHVLFIDNECRAGGGITIGSEGSGGVHNITFENIYYNSAASESGAARRGPSGPGAFWVVAVKFQLVCNTVSLRCAFIQT